MYYRRSIRLKGYDYSQPGKYFVTICTEHKECIFGKIINGKMILNEWGNCAEQFCSMTENHFSEIKFDSYVIMPNHIHVIISITNPNAIGAKQNPVEARSPRLNGNNGNNGNNGGEFYFKGRGDLAPTLGQIIGFYKYGVSKHINLIRGKTGVKLWQRNYYEHIIQNPDEYCRIRQYINNNPLKWYLDFLNRNKLK